jgi:CBS domain-containing protein
MGFTARDYMSRKFVTFSPDMDILEAVDKIVANNISGGPVVDRLGNLVGILSEIDCVRSALQGSYHESWSGRVSDVMRRDFRIIDIDDSIMHVAKMFSEQGSEHYYYRGMPVMKQNRVVGRIILRDVLRAFEDMAREGS